MSEFRSKTEVGGRIREVRSAPQQRTYSNHYGRSVWCHKRSFRLLTGRRTIVAWQGNDELGEFAEPRFDVDPAAVLLDNDVMGHREAQPCPFAGRFSGEKGIEHLLSDFRRDTSAVVANANFHTAAEIFGGSQHGRLFPPHHSPPCVL